VADSDQDQKMPIVNSLHNPLFTGDTRIGDQRESLETPTGQAEPGSFPRQKAVEFEKGETVREVVEK
jgi:hypothetical protein